MRWVTVRIRSNNTIIPLHRDDALQIKVRGAKPAWFDGDEHLTFTFETRLLNENTPSL